MNDVPKGPAQAAPAGAFDAAAWREQLLELNPWARGLAIDEDDKAFAAARQRATLYRHAKGREIWNAWAREILGRRKALEDAQRWVVGRVEPTKLVSGRNDETRLWLALATAVFSTEAMTHTFKYDAPFSEFVFPAAAMFEAATFATDASFQDAAFSANASFQGAIFYGTVSFQDTIFFAGAWFEKVDFYGNTTFHQVPSFIAATFRGTLRLDYVRTPPYRFLGWTPVDDAPARFRELKRLAVQAQDRDSELEFFAQEIRTARFHANALVPAWKTEAAKDGKRRLTWQRVPLPSWLPRVWSWRFWFGLAYGAFSNFGRSFLRPLVVWLALLLGFAVFYLGQHEGQHIARKALKPDGAWARVGAYVATARAAWAIPPKCAAPSDKSPSDKLVASTNVVNEALLLSASNALVVFNLGRSDASRRTYGCLYGFEHGGPQAPPIVPYRVAVASTLQTLASAVLIFLFLLAVRNLLRLK